jgi:predicted PurR-regulated permease PerM
MTSNRRLFLDARTARVAWTVLVFIGALGLAYALRNVFVLVVMSLFFAFLLFPLVRLTQRVIQHRLSAIAAVYLVVLATLGGAGIAVGPRLGTEARNLVQQLPEVSKRIQNGELVVGVLARTGWERGQIRAIDRILQTHMGTIVGYAQHTAANGLKWLAGGWMVLLIPVFAFFILKDSERLTSVVIWRLGSDARRGMWWGLAEDLSLLLGQYVRALVLLALITFVAWSAVFLTVGVPYALVLAAVGGALEFIPVIGPLGAGVVVIGVGLLTGYAHPGWLVVFLLAWRVIQDYAVSPLVMGRGIDIHPALVIVGVLAGGEIAGVAGMFLSVPLIAAVRIVWRRLQTPDTAPVDDPVPIRVLDGAHRSLTKVP